MNQQVNLKRQLELDYEVCGKAVELSSFVRDKSRVKVVTELLNEQLVRFIIAKQVSYLLEGHRQRK